MSPTPEAVTNLWKKLKPGKKISHRGSELEIWHDDSESVQRVPVQVGKTTVGELKMTLKKFSKLTGVLESLPNEEVLGQPLLDQLIRNFKLSVGETAPASTSAPQSDQRAQPSSAPAQQTGNKMSVSNNEWNGAQDQPDKFQTNILAHKINPDLPLDASVDGNKATGSTQRNINVSETTDAGFRSLLEKLATSA